VSCDGSFVVSASSDATLRIWDTASGAELATLVGHAGSVNACAVSPDGFVVSAGQDQTLRLWDREGHELSVFAGHAAPVTACAVSPAESRFVSASLDGTLKIWDAEAGVELATLRGHAGGVEGCAIGPDGSLIASAGADGTVRVWDASTGKERSILTGHGLAVSDCAIAPGGDFVVSAGQDGTVRVWDTSAGAEVAKLEAFAGPVNGCAVSPDGRSVVSASQDGTVRIWDAASGTPLSVLEGHAGSVHACAMTPDGRLVVSAGQDRTVRMWEAAAVPAEAPAAAAPPSEPLDEEVLAVLHSVRRPPEVTRREGDAALQPLGDLPDLELLLRDEERLDRLLAEAREELLRDLVDCTVFAPSAASPGDAVMVQVFAHTPEQSEAAAAQAREFDLEAERRGVATLETEVADGTRLTFDLALPGLLVDEPVQTLVWRRRPASVQFGVVVPEDRNAGTVIGKVTVSQEGIPVGRIRFKLDIAEVVEAAAAESAPTGDDAHRYALAFISYASPDRGEVLRRVQTLKSVGIRYFQDLLDLDPGERWEKGLYEHIDACDLFLLFWSSAARESEWVEKEACYALDREGGPPEIRPIVIEGPPVAPPFERLAHLHFNDLLIYLIDAESRT
jgi:hypothetical protein